jgi:hypothetical protein
MPAFAAPVARTAGTAAKDDMLATFKTRSRAALEPTRREESLACDREAERRRQVDPERFLEHGRVPLARFAAKFAAGVVHEDVEATDIGRQRVDRCRSRTSSGRYANAVRSCA